MTKPITRRPYYGAAHIRRREDLLPAAIGQACAVCGYEMRIGQALDLDHSDPIAKAAGEPGDRIIHTECNRSPRLRTGWSTRDRLCEVCGNPYHATHSVQYTCGRVCGAEFKRRNKAAGIVVPQQKTKRG